MGSAFKNKGIQLVLDAVVDFLPSPTEVDPQDLTDEETGEPTGEVATVSVDEPFRALAFKIMDDRFGALTFIRIYSGKLNKGDTILNSATGKTERIGRMVEMHADERTGSSNGTTAVADECRGDARRDAAVLQQGSTLMA